MKLTEEKIEAINNCRRNNDSLKIKNGCDGICVVKGIMEIATIDEIDDLIKDLENLKDAFEREVGIILK